MQLYFSLGTHSTVKTVKILMERRALQGQNLHIEDKLE